MEDLKSLYLEIENPLDNKVKWSKIINFYSKSLNYEDFYSSIVREKSDQKTYYDEDSKNNLILFLWSNFKHRLLSLEDKEIVKLIDDRVFSSTVFDVIKKLKELKSITKYEDLLEVLTDPQIVRYFNELYYDFTKSVVISSDFRILSKESMNTVLSMRVDPKYLYLIVKGYIDECIKYEMPYYIKFDEFSKKVVINFYTTISNYRTNLSILNMLKKENFSYFFENKDLLSANIGKFIAVRHMNLYNNYDFSREKTSIIFKSFDSVLYDYVINHPNILVAYKAGRMNITEYLASFVMEKIIGQIISDNASSKDEYYLLANSKELTDLKTKIKEKLYFDMKNILKDRLYLKNSDEIIPFEFTKEKTINIDVDIFMVAIRNLISILITKDSNLEKLFRIRIKNECEFLHVDPLKFSIGYSFKELLLFNKEKYDDYNKELELINNDMNKIKEYERLINSENKDELRDRIKDAFNDALNAFTEEVVN